MAFIVTESCIKCKHTDCVEVCPVDCFYEGPNFLVIHPEECIDCALCEPECPVDAIFSEDELPDDQIPFIEINAELSELILTGKLSDKFDENTKTIEGIQGPTGTKVDNIKLDPLNESKFDVKSFNQFKIGTSTYETPEDFLKAVDKMSKSLRN